MKKPPRNIVVSIGPDEPLRKFLEDKATLYRTTPNLFLAMIAQALYLWEVEGDTSMLHIFPHPPLVDSHIETIARLLETTLQTLIGDGGYVRHTPAPDTPSEVTDTDALDSFLDGL